MGAGQVMYANALLLTSLDKGGCSDCTKKPATVGELVFWDWHSGDSYVKLADYFITRLVHRQLITWHLYALAACRQPYLMKYAESSVVVISFNSWHIHVINSPMPQGVVSLSHTPLCISMISGVCVQGMWNAQVKGQVTETHRLKVNSHCDTALFISMYDITMVQP